MENQIKPGDKVTCSLYPDRGVGECTLFSESLNQVFIVWSEKKGAVLGNKYALCTIEQVIKVDEYQKAE